MSIGLEIILVTFLLTVSLLLDLPLIEIFAKALKRHAKHVKPKERDQTRSEMLSETKTSDSEKKKEEMT